MTRWFPIAPGTTLPTAPVAVGGQITATSTVPVWNETALLAARSRTQLVVTSLNYRLALLTEVTPLVTNAVLVVNKVVLINAAVADLAISPVAPLVSSGASVAAPAVVNQLAAATPLVSGGASVSVPVTALSMAAADAEVIGNPKVAIAASLTEITLTAQLPAISKGVSIQAPAAAISLAASAPYISDPRFSSVSLLLHMDGSNDSTTFTDSSSNIFTLTAYGNAKLSTAQKKFGSASGVFDGNGDYLTASSNSAFNFGTGDFTVEAWVRLNATDGYNTFASYLNAGGAITGTNMGWVLEYYTGLGFRFFFYSGATPYIASNSASPSVNTWYHLAAVRNSGTMTLYVNGVGGTGASANYTVNNPASVGLNIGRLFASGSSTDTRFVNGYIDELRITKGVARYTSNFTPPSGPFPDS